MLPPYPRAFRPGRRRRPIAAAVPLLLLPFGARLDAQQAALPPSTRVQGEALRTCDAATVNIDWEEARVALLPLLTRLPGLRRLQINPDSEATGGWQQLTPDDLAPLLELPALETLTIPYCAHLSVAHLQRLAGCKRLASLSCINEAFTLDAAIAAALAELPALRTLDLSLIRVTPAGLAALAKVERLERLDLSHCRDLDAAGMAAVAGLAQLRSLELSGVGRPDMLQAMRGGGAPETWALDAASMQRLAAMPNLRELGLRECTLAPHLLAGLPPKLTSLQLQGWQVDAAAIADLRRLADLRALDLRPAATSAEVRQQVAAAAAGVLGSLHLEQLRWYGALPPELRSVIAGQADLRQLGLPLVDDLAFVASLPKLEHLLLWPRLPPLDGEESAEPGVQPRDLAVLRASKSLRRLTWHDRTLDAATVAALQQALGAQIELQQQ